MISKIKDYVVITFGVILVAIALYFFIMPNDIAGGGVNGLAMVMNVVFPVIPVGGFMFIVNIVLFVVAFILIGKDFGARTIYSSFLLTGVIWVLEKTYPIKKPFTNDVLLELFFAIFIQAVGLAIVFNKNASTGGTDIVAKILNKYFHIKLGKGVLLADLVVTVLAGLTFGFQKGLYALLVVILNGLVVDKAIEGLNLCKEVKIISSKNVEIQKFILDELGRGATIYYAKGAYTCGQIEVLTTIVDSREFIKIKNYIREIDKAAFVSVIDAYETLGDGFKAL